MTTTPERTATLTALVAAEIRAQMGRLNVKQAELARRMGENDTWVHARLKQGTPIDLNDLLRFARALGVGVHDLMPSAETADSAALAPKGRTPRRRGREDGLDSVTSAYRIMADRPAFGGRPPDNRPSGHPSATATTGVRRSALLPRRPRRDRP